jgi:hypothetical protein
VARKAKASGVAVGTPAKSKARRPAEAPQSSASDMVQAVVANAAVPKSKLVRDSFTIPKSEYMVLDGLKARAANLTRHVKKSELLRAGIAALNAMNDKAFLAALSGVPSLKTGRPKGADAASPDGQASK